MNNTNRFQIGRKRIEPGQTCDWNLKVSESYAGTPIRLPLRIVRGPEPGPALLVTAAIHGDELNGTGVVRELIVNRPPRLLRGTLVLIPVVNILGFERHARYMPDRRDLNRSFPGSSRGSLTARFAHVLFDDIISQCQYCIDLHSAATRRINRPHIRADLRNESVKRLAMAFGCGLIVDNAGPSGSMRREASRAGCATVVLEAGEIWKIEPAVVEVGVRGVLNVLAELGMVKDKPVACDRQLIAEKSMWVRSMSGGLLQFHAAPGDLVRAGQPIATTCGLLGEDYKVLPSPVNGIVLGMTTMPAVKPGDPICHVAAVRDDSRGVDEANSQPTNRGASGKRAATAVAIDSL
jgi:uncharacterized protein